MGNKTTNAKAKLLQTPAAQGDGDAGKTAQNSVSARKPKPKVSHAEMTKLEVLGDKDELEDEEPEIEYMPPRSKSMKKFNMKIMVTNLFQICLTILMISLQTSIFPCLRART